MSEPVTEETMQALSKLQGAMEEASTNLQTSLRFFNHTALTRLMRSLRTLDSGAQGKTAMHLITGVRPRHPFMEPIMVPIGILFYLLLKPLLASICRHLGTTGKSRTFKAFALVHNILLCTYSCWTAVNVWYLTFTHFVESPIAIYCNSDLWDAGLAYWGFLFYLSKYWELVDTFLLIWKQRKPSYLQVYHHAVTIICAYMLQVSHARVTFVFVGLNSAVHTVMYAYYGLCVVGLRWRGKSCITVMQIVQFIIGICLAAPTFWLRGGSCATDSQKIAVGAVMAHAAYLAILFAQFYAQAYRQKRKTE